MPEINDKTDFDAVIRKHVWKLIAMGALIGAILVIGAFSAYHLGGRSVFCGSCHSMEKNYFTWKTSRHKQFACIECHIPAGNAAYAVVYKGYAGLRDITSETIRSYPFAITLTYNARNIANTNCFRCHFSTIENTSMSRGGTDCIRCHRFLVHGRPTGNGGISY
ncbi:MAG: NapC/NirT family cytochrome c [Syntrophorhabdus sp.]